MAQKIAHVGSWEYYVKEDKAIWSDELFQDFWLEASDVTDQTQLNTSLGFTLRTVKR